jgi:PadR family transcriptional regulator PadR
VSDGNGKSVLDAPLPRHYLRPCLLLLLAEGPSHGYELLEQVRALGLRGAEAGGLYRCLRTMEKDEIVSSWWEPSQAGPARRTYRLTATGQGALREELRTLRSVRHLLVALLDRYEQHLRGRSTATTVSGVTTKAATGARIDVGGVDTSPPE